MGIRSTALLFGKDTKTWLLGFSTLSSSAFLAAGAASGCFWPYYAAVTAATCHMAWQVKTVDLDNGADCSAKFVSNKWVGAIIFAGTVAGRALVL